MVRAPLRVGRGMFDDSLFCLLTISSYLGSVVSDCRALHHFVAAPFELVSTPEALRLLGKLIRFRGRGTKKARFFARSHPRKIFPS